MGTAPIHRLIRLPALLRQYERYLEETSKRLLHEFDREVSHLKGDDIGVEKAEKLRKYLAAFSKDFARHKYKRAGKDFQRLMDEIADLEKQLGR